ncbi:MAG: type II toxin-antitoxin system RelE/ParE family toxin [Sphingorhabdus sp.]
MVWKIEISDQARKQARKLSKADADRITRSLQEIAALEDPRQRGHGLVGHYAVYWRYRVGDYRIIAKIEDGRLVVIVIAIGHRREEYR